MSAARFGMTADRRRELERERLAQELVSAAAVGYGFGAVSDEDFERFIARADELKGVAA